MIQRDALIQSDWIQLGALLKSLSEEKSALLTNIAESKTTAISAFEKKLEAERAVAAVEKERVSALRRKVQAYQADQFVTQQNQIRSTLKEQIDSSQLQHNFSFLKLK